MPRKHRKLFTREQFNELINEALRSIPERFQAHLDNVSVESVDRPSAKDRRDLELGPGQTLFGLYRGVPLTNRSVFQNPIQPERIVIFQEPLEGVYGADRAELVRQIRLTVLHEIGHHFGLSDADMCDLE